jgi:hypothetical protein
MVGVLTGAYFSVSSALESQKMVESRADIAQTARVALALLSQDLRAACPLARDLDFAGLHRLRGEITADNLDFSTHNWHPVAPGEGDVCEVSYFVDQNPETGEVGLWRRRDPSPDEKPLEGGRREEIAAGVRGFRLEYYDGFRWYESWGKTSGSEVEEKASSRTEFNWYGLPDAVRIQLTLSAPQESRQERSPQPKQATGGAMGGGAMGGGAMGQPKSPRTMTFQTVVRLNLSTRPKGSTGPGIEPPGSSSAGSPAPPGQGGK